MQQREVRAQIPDPVLAGITDIAWITLLIDDTLELTPGWNSGENQRYGCWVKPMRPIRRRLPARLGKSTPPLLFGVGEQTLLDDGGLAIVGSRDADEVALEFTRQDCLCMRARRISRLFLEELVVVDREAMLSGLDAGGNTVGVLADSLGREAFADRYRTVS